ncbi:MAG TPA: NAD(P)H-hydrate dehydratase, partial [Thermoanaerobaculia bacterium]|nr:NAD(P)H-hydrate dehydratase [Thermoanaerobaculia bacterium]
MRVLTLEEVRAIDRRAIEQTGIPGLVLMENAALAVVDAVGERFPDARRVTVLCGPGNNGADGLAVGRQLDARGYDVRLLLARHGRELSRDCRAQLGILEQLGVGVELLDDPPRRLDDADLIVDALFGAGLTRPLEGPWAEVVAAMAAAARPIVAIDLPSGLDGDLDRPIGPVAPADLTVTFVAPKPALILPPACDLAGEVVVGDLGFRVDPGGGPGALHLLLGEELLAAVADRAPDAHKGRFGHVLLVAGGRGKAGAAVLAARAAIAAGAGLVTVATPEECVPALAAGCPEAMTLPLPATADGTLAAAAAEPILAAAADRSVLAIGPGLGRGEEVESLVRRVVLAVALPMVLDADGLNAFEGRCQELARRPATSVLTPHPGEAARLLGGSAAEIQVDRLAAARGLAARSRAVVALKGRRTIVAAPDGEAWVNATGNPGMAS